MQKNYDNSAAKIKTDKSGGMRDNASVGQEINAYLEEKAKLIDTELHKYLADKANTRYIENLIGRAGFKYDPEAVTNGILKPAWYLLNQGGKRFRPVLTMLVLDAHGKNPNNYIEFAIIPEVIHNATLIKDDIEDGSKTRRGAPAVHVKFGLDIATNTSDFMYFFPMKALEDSRKLDVATKNRIYGLYFKDMSRIALGQDEDLVWHSNNEEVRINIDNITADKYLEMARDKTGVLTGFAMALGGILAGVDRQTEEKLDKVGSLIGVIFQIQDDILNLYPSELSRNKGGVGDDITEGKITLLVIHALQNASAKDKGRLKDILSMHTTDKRSIAEAIAILDKYGSADYARKKANKLEAEIISLIKEAMPDSSAKDLLLNLVHYLITRNK